MSCYHPLNAIRSKLYKKKKDGTFYRPLLYAPIGTEFMPYEFLDVYTGEYTEETQFKIPCGRCVGCRLDYAKAWANRMTMESITQDEHFSPNLTDFFECKTDADFAEVYTWFITFTYADYALPKGRVLDDGSQHSSVFMKDFQDFLKRLRMHMYRKHGYIGKIAYYYAAEYGDTTMRPHYHAIFWYLPLFDLKYYARTNLGDVLYNSSELTDLWGKGHVVVAQSNWNTCAYTARYVMKKQSLTSSEYCDLFDNIGIDAPYVRMSRRPGIGMRYFEDHMNDIYMYDQIVLPATKKGVVLKCKPPHIFDTKYGKYFPDELKVIKENRKYSAEIAQKNLLQKTEKSHEQYLHDGEEIKIKAIKALKRRL